MIDRFDQEVIEDVAALPQEGKRYLYTVIPIDLAGNASPRPLSFVAQRLPADPPMVPGDGELVIEYGLPDDPDLKTLDVHPVIRQPDAIRFQWSDPLASTSKTTSPPVDKYRLVFRREAALPIGFYGADSDTRGGRSAGFPVTNARTLRTDQIIVIDRNDVSRQIVTDPETDEPLRSNYRQIVQQITLSQAQVADLKKKLMPDDGTWRPDAWRVFVQTVTRPRGAKGEVEGVVSALAAVSVRMRFQPAASPPTPTGQADTTAGIPVKPHAGTPYEDRKFGLLEWLPNPLRFNLLPPEDQSARSGFALVPMPRLDSEDGSAWSYRLDPRDTSLRGNLSGLRFEPHPERFRALKMTWNQGPSGDRKHPIELHAKYQLFEFDADAHTAEALDFPDTSVRHLGEWARGANLRVVQEVELMPPEDLALNPADTSKPVAWEAWTPTTSRRIMLRNKMIANRGIADPAKRFRLGSWCPTWPETTDETKFGPWYSWRDSYLEWPDAKESNFSLNAPPQLDPSTQRLWPFHIVLRASLAHLINLPESPAQPGKPWPLAKFTVELCLGPARGDIRSGTTTDFAPGGGNKPANPYPDPNNHPFPDDKATTPVPVLKAFIAGNSPESDPHAWGLLDRMGLAVTFRVRERKTGDYILGQDLAELIRRQLLSLKAHQVTVPAGTSAGQSLTLKIKANADGVFYLPMDRGPDARGLSPLPQAWLMETKTRSRWSCLPVLERRLSWSSTGAMRPSVRFRAHRSQS